MTLSHDDTALEALLAPLRAFAQDSLQELDAEPSPPIDPVPDTGDLTPMLEDLCTLARNDMTGQDLLLAQAQTLNMMFARVLYRTFNHRDFYNKKPIPDYLSPDMMRLALEIQKQGAETLRIRGALDYMRDLAPPPSPKIENEKKDHEKHL